MEHHSKQYRRIKKALAKARKEEIIALNNP